MHHKRGRPKNARAGCLMCKAWKVNGASKVGGNLKGQWKRIAAHARAQLRGDGE